MIHREITNEAKSALKQYPILTITGPRQSGKTTLAKQLFSSKPYFSLEDPDIRLLAENDPRGFLVNFPNGGIIDEIQRVPSLINYLQTYTDEKSKPGQFILTGSKQFKLIENITQSLAGRTNILKLLPFSLSELKQYKEKLSVDALLSGGCFPRVWEMGMDPYKAYRNYIETYVEKDLKQLIQIKELSLFQKFLSLIAGRIASLCNFTQLSNEVGVSVPTIEKWLSVLEASYILFRLPPWFDNISKRLVKTPKIYFYDTGLATYLLNIENSDQLKRDPLRGALFENFVIVEKYKKRFNKGLDTNYYFFRDKTGNEVDILQKNGHLLKATEIKSAATFNSDFLKGVKYLQKLYPDRISESEVVYGGDRAIEFHMTKIVPLIEI